MMRRSKRPQPENSPYPPGYVPAQINGEVIRRWDPNDPESASLGYEIRFGAPPARVRPTARKSPDDTPPTTQRT